MKPYIYAIFAAVLSGTVGVFVKLIGDDSMHFMTLNFYRVFLAFLFLLVIVPLIDKKAFKLKKKDVIDYFMIGIVMALAFSLYNVAIIFAPIQNAALLVNTSSFFVMFFAYFMLKESITVTKVTSLLIAIIGLVIINPFRFGGEFALGNLLALSSAFFYGILLVGMRKENKSHGIGDVMWFFFFASVVLLPFPFIFGFGFDAILDSDVLVLLLPLGFFSTGLAYLYYNLSLQKIEAEMLSIIRTIVIPLVSIVLAVLYVDEIVETRVVIGGLLLILAGVYLEAHTKIVRGRKRKKKERKSNYNTKV